MTTTGTMRITKLQDGRFMAEEDGEKGFGSTEAEARELLRRKQGEATPPANDPERKASGLSVSVDLVAAAQKNEAMRALPLEQLQRDARDYGRFLRLAQLHEGPFAPTREIDQMWHLHMLHPAAYQRDCMEHFGRVLDHDGGFGMAPEERAALGQAFARTARLWQQEFGEPYVAGAGTAESCWHDCESRCWHACSSKAPNNQLAHQSPAS